jgi:hypothetical protein
MGETVSAKSVSSRVKRFPQWYGRVPLEVSSDSSISSDCVRVYSLIVLGAFQGNVVYIGMRQIATLSGMSPATVMRRIRELESAGHLVVKKDSAGKRSWYELTSPVFGQKQRANVDSVLVSGPRKRLVTVRTG